MNRFLLFVEAMNHARNKTLMRTFISSLELDTLLQCSFLQAFQTISESKPKGIGLLGVYDIASAVARHNNEKLDKVYLVGNGPMRAAHLLSLTQEIKHQKIGHVIVPYLPTYIVIEKCKENHMSIMDDMDGDQLESFLCNFQKDIKPTIDASDEIECEEIEIDGITYLYDYKKDDLYTIDCEYLGKRNARM